jgi:hypothetical protein
MPPRPLLARRHPIRATSARPTPQGSDVPGNFIFRCKPVKKTPPRHRLPATLAISRGSDAYLPVPTTIIARRETAVGRRHSGPLAARGPASTERRATPLPAIISRQFLFLQPVYPVDWPVPRARAVARTTEPGEPHRRLRAVTCPYSCIRVCDSGGRTAIRRRATSSSRRQPAHERLRTSLDCHGESRQGLGSGERRAAVADHAAALRAPTRGRSPGFRLRLAGLPRRPRGPVRIAPPVGRKERR